jgi:hypothetical protein
MATLTGIVVQVAIGPQESRIIDVNLAPAQTPCGQITSLDNVLRFRYRDADAAPGLGDEVKIQLVV